MGFYETIRIKGKTYTAEEKKGWPLDELEYKRIHRLRRQIANMQKTIKEYIGRIKTKNNFLEEIYDNFLKNVEKYDKKRRSNKSSGASKP